MRVLLAGALLLGLAAPALAAETAAAAPSCTMALQSLSADWDAAGYPAPSKPSQMVVVGRNGHIATGPQVTYMRSQMEFAAQDCAAGDSQAALERIGKVSAMLRGATVTMAGDAR